MRNRRFEGALPGGLLVLLIFAHRAGAIPQILPPSDNEGESGPCNGTSGGESSKHCRYGPQPPAPDPGGCSLPMDSGDLGLGGPPSGSGGGAGVAGMGAPGAGIYPGEAGVGAGAHAFGRIGMTPRGHGGLLTDLLGDPRVGNGRGGVAGSPLLTNGLMGRESPMDPTVAGSVQYGLVETADGQYRLYREDIHIPGRGLDFLFARLYRSDRSDPTATDNAFGHGWSFTYTDRVRQEPCSREPLPLWFPPLRRGGLSPTR